MLDMSLLDYTFLGSNQKRKSYILQGSDMICNPRDTRDTLSCLLILIRASIQHDIRTHT